MLNFRGVFLDVYFYEIAYFWGMDMKISFQKDQILCERISLRKHPLQIYTV